MRSRFHPLKLYDVLNRHGIPGQFARYAIIGVFNVSAFLAIFNLMLFAGVHPQISNATAFVLTSISSFFLNKRWTFGDRRGGAVAVRMYFVFVFFTLVGLAINLTLFSLFLIPLRRYGTLGHNIAALAPLPFTVLWNFSSYRLWTFKPNAGSS